MVEMRVGMLASAAFMLWLVSCSDEPKDACNTCNPDSEYCVVFHSDVAGEDPTTTCETFPASCDEEPSCGCLEGATSDDFNLEFCITEGGCSEADGVVVVECPGG